MRRVILAVLLLAAAYPAAPVGACTQPAGGHPSYSVAVRAWSADVVVLGRVTAVESPNPFSQRATIAVDEYLKGSGPSRAAIDGFGSTAICLVSAQVGMYGLFFADRLRSGELQASYLSFADAYDPATPEEIAQVRRALGPGLALPFVVR